MPRRELTLEQVQRWVVSFLVLAVAMFPLGALVAVISTLIDDGRRTDATLLLVVMALLGVIAGVSLRLIHGRHPLSLWLVVGTVPAIAAAVATM